MKITAYEIVICMVFFNRWTQNIKFSMYLYSKNMKQVPGNKLNLFLSGVHMWPINFEHTLSNCLLLKNIFEERFLSQIGTSSFSRKFLSMFCEMDHFCSNLNFIYACKTKTEGTHLLKLIDIQNFG